MFKKSISLALACAMMLSLGGTAFAEVPTQSSNEINLIDVYNNPEKYSDIEIIVHETIDDYINVVSNDNNLSSDTKARLVADAKNDTSSGASYKYLTFKQAVLVKTGYYCYPYFYVKCEMLGVSHSSFVEVKNANLDRNYNGKSKQFDGSLYYNLETDNRLYWDLNGDFYHNGNMVSDGAPTPLDGAGTTTFTATNTSNHFEYINKIGVFKI